MKRKYIIFCLAALLTASSPALSAEAPTVESAASSTPKRPESSKETNADQPLPAATAPTPAGTPVPQQSNLAPEIPGNLALPADGRPKLALTLAGGGARGAAHIGALKVLEQHGIRPDFVSGSSIGAVVGVLYCSGMPIAQIEDLFVNGQVRKAFIPNPLPWQVVKALPGYALKRIVGQHPPIGLFNGDKIARFISRNLPPDRQNIEQFPIPFTAISTNLLDTRPVWITKGDAGKMVQSSCSVPFIYQPVEVEKQELVDGGVRANLATTPASAAGAPLIVAVRLHGSLNAQSPATFRTVFAYADRVLSILLSEVESQETARADVLIEPDVGDMHLYSFDRPTMIKAIAAGETAAQRMLPQLRARLRLVPNAAVMLEPSSTH